MKNKNYILYCGSYTEMIDENFGGHGEGIYCFEFNSNNGDLKLLHIQNQVNPSYLCVVNPEVESIYNYTKSTLLLRAPSSILITVNEVLSSKNPSIHIYEINKNDHRLTLIQSQPIEGGCPCHISHFKDADGNNYVGVACYETGNVILYDINKDGNLSSCIISHEGNSQHPLRQNAAHAHCVSFDKVSNKLLIADLGIDQIRVYTIQKNNEIIKVTENQIIHIPAGSGPRHLCFDSNYRYGFNVNELTGSVTFIKHINNSYDLKGTISLLEPSSLHDDLGAAAIRVSANGAFIYTTIRSDNTIRLFAFDSVKESLNLVDSYPTGGITPRDFIIDPTGQWLLVAHQYSDAISIFNVNSYDGTLSLFKIIDNIKSPVCLSWLIT